MNINNLKINFESVIFLANKLIKDVNITEQEISENYEQISQGNMILKNRIIKSNTLNNDNNFSDILNMILGFMQMFLKGEVSENCKKIIYNTLLSENILVEYGKE